MGIILDTGNMPQIKITVIMLFYIIFSLSTNDFGDSLCTSLSDSFLIAGIWKCLRAQVLFFTTWGCTHTETLNYLHTNNTLFDLSQLIDTLGHQAST